MIFKCILDWYLSQVSGNTNIQLLKFIFTCFTIVAYFHKSMAEHKRDLTSLLTIHWSYVSFAFLHQNDVLETIELSLSPEIQCSTIIMQSIFADILTKNTPWGWKLGVFCELWFNVCPSHYSALKILCYIGPSYNDNQLYAVFHCPI